MMNMIRKMRRDTKGATAIEYGLIAALIAVASITSLNALSGNVNGTFDRIGTSLAAA